MARTESVKKDGGGGWDNDLKVKGSRSSAVIARGSSSGRDPCLH